MSNSVVHIHRLQYPNKILLLISQAGKVILWESPIHQKLNKSPTQSTREIRSSGLHLEKMKINQKKTCHYSPFFFFFKVVKCGGINIYIDVPDGSGQDIFCLLFVFIQSAQKGHFTVEATGESFVGKEFLLQTHRLVLSRPSSSSSSSLPRSVFSPFFD